MSTPVPIAPNLPLAPPEYRTNYFDQLTNTLRLYFNQLDGFNKVTNHAYGNFQARATQTLPGADTATKVLLDTDVDSNAVSLDTSTHRLMVMRSGRYLFSFNLLHDTGSTRYLWFRLNGADVVESTQNVSGSSLINMTPADYVEMYWASSNPSDTLTYTAATAFCPATPAVNLNVTFVST